MPRGPTMLELAALQRDGHTQQARVALGEAQAELQAVRGRVAAAQQALRSAQRARHQHAADVPAQLPAAQLARSARYGEQLRSEEHALQQALELRRGELTAAEGRMQACQRQLAQRSAEREVLAREQQRQARRARTGSLEREDEAAEEALAARRPR